MSRERVEMCLDCITLIFLNEINNGLKRFSTIKMERNNFTVLLYILIPVKLRIAQWCPRKWRFLFTVSQLGLYAVIACSAMPRATPADDYSFGTSMPVF